MKILYCRISTFDQKLDRQKVSEKEYDLTIEDKCSGAIPFFERAGGKQIMRLVNKGALTSVAVHAIDRLGRDLRDILNTIHFFTDKKIAISFISQGLVTLNSDGKQNPISKLIISILGTVGEMERDQLKERQKEGIFIAKSKGVYKGRKKGAIGRIDKFLSKPKHLQVLNYLKKGISSKDIFEIMEAKQMKVNKNTITKIKRLGMPPAETKRIKLHETSKIA